MIKFLQYNSYYFAFSSLLLLVALGSIFMLGLKPSIDFTGGSVLEVSTNYELVNAQERISEIEENSGIKISFVQNITSPGNESSDNFTYQIKSQEMDSSNKQNVIDAVETVLTEDIQDGIVVANETLENEADILAVDNTTELAEVNELNFEFIGPVLGKELIVKTIISIVLVSLILLYYISKQFSDTSFGLAAITALIHDTTIVLGTFAILGYLLNAEIDLLFVTAILTTLSFSLHDTIVVFDRIREISRVDSKRTFEESVNIALNQTIVRSVNTSIVLIILLASIAILGGSTIRFFVLALLSGLVIGTYSSPFVASPVLAYLSRRNAQNQESKVKKSVAVNNNF